MNEGRTTSHRREPPRTWDTDLPRPIDLNQKRTRDDDRAAIEARFFFLCFLVACCFVCGVGTSGSSYMDAFR